MIEEKRGPGRPPKVRPEVAPALTEQAAAPEVLIYQAPSAPTVRMVEVELIRKYAPGGQTEEIQRTVPPGTVMKLPQAEATRALKIGIARATDATFG